MAVSYRFPFFKNADNSTDDLEVRVTLLEDDITDLETDVEELRTYNILQDERFLIIEGNVAENSYDVDGNVSCLVQMLRDMHGIVSLE